jgi:hypothetical protein
MPTHFEEEDFEQNFPDGEDVYPLPLDHENFIDAIFLNSLAASIVAIEGYLITYKENIEGGGGGPEWQSILLEPGEWDYLTEQTFLTSTLGEYV